MLGILVHELATGHRPLGDSFPIDILVSALFHKEMKLDLAADIVNRRRSESQEREHQVLACTRMCMQSVMDECVLNPPSNQATATLLAPRFTLCAGANYWSPLRILVNIECMTCSEDASMVYWASGSRGLITGSLEPSTGNLSSSILQEAPTPESGLFANRRGKPIPIAVGRATTLALVHATQQLWVGTENGLMGSVYVFNLPDMRRPVLHLRTYVEGGVPWDFPPYSDQFPP